MIEAFRKFAEHVAHAVGSPVAFLLAVTIIAIWGITGPYFDYSDTWQLLINTGTTIVTFLMVFVIQNTQNRDAKVTALKLDELLRAVEGARTEFVALDDMPEDELMHVQGEFKKLEEKYGHLVRDDLKSVEEALCRRRKG